MACSARPVGEWIDGLAVVAILNHETDVSAVRSRAC